MAQRLKHWLLPSAHAAQNRLSSCPGPVPSTGLHGWTLCTHTVHRNRPAHLEQKSNMKKGC